MKIYLPVWEGVYEEEHQPVAFYSREKAQEWIENHTKDSKYVAWEFRIDEIELE